MANKKSESNKTESSNKKSTTVLSLNKISFWLIVATAILYLLAMILHLCGLPAALVGSLQAVATAIMICIVSVLGWRYVRNKGTVWIVLYVVVLLVVLVGIVLPLAL